jgi:AraC-like DNA-binding protein
MTLDLHPAQRAVLHLCAALFNDPERVVFAARIPLLGALRQPMHQHADLLQFDLVVGCTGGWVTPDGLVAAEGITAATFYPHQRHGHDLVPVAGPALSLRSPDVSGAMGDGGECLSVKVRVDADWPVVSQQPFPAVAREFPQDRALLSAARRVAQWRPHAHVPIALFLSEFCRMLALWPQEGGSERLGLTFDDAPASTALRDVATLLEERSKNPPSLDDLARVAHMSPRHLARRFAAAYGCTPRAYADQWRLARAQALLLHQDVAIKIIADELGFASVHHFTRWFTRHTGVAPGRYRDGRGPL